MAGGRPTTYTDDLANTICARLVEGESLRAICLNEDMPGLATVFGWLRKDPEFAKQYAIAREEQAETYAAEIKDIADEECTMVKASKHPGVAKDDEEELEVVFDAVAVARNRLRIDTRKWVASKLKPKVYGDRIQHDHDVVGSLADDLAAARDRSTET